MLLKTSTNRLKRRSSNRLAQVGVATPTAATSMTLTDVMIDRIFQRVGTSKSITVAGTVAGPCSQVQGRVAGGAWAVLQNNPTGGVYSGLLPVTQGGWHTLQVQDSVNTTIGASGTAKFGVGVMVALLGQSNMANMFTQVSQYFLSDNKTRKYKAGTWGHVGNYDGTDTFQAGTPYTTYGATYTAVSPMGDSLTLFANAMRSGINAPVGVFPHAVGGSTIASWQPSGGANWNTFAADLAASGGDCEAAIFLQGENDAQAGTSSASYQSSLLNVLNGLKSATGRNSSNFHFGVVALGPGTTYAAEGNMGIIRAAHLDFVAAHASDGVYLAACAHDMDLGGSNIHFSGLERIAKRYAKGLLNRFGILVHGAQGPKITSATRSGAVVTVHITHNGGTSLADGTGGSGSALLGFRVYDAGSLCTISSTAISGNTVVLTLSATPAGAVTMDYAMANAPYGATTALASVVYDNDTVPGDTLGLPLQPHALMAVT